MLRVPDALAGLASFVQLRSLFVRLVILCCAALSFLDFSPAQSPPEPTEGDTAEPAAKVDDPSLEEKYQSALKLLKQSEEKQSRVKAYSCTLYAKASNGEESPEEGYDFLMVRREPLQVYGYMLKYQGNRGAKGQEYFYDSTENKEPYQFYWPGCFPVYVLRNFPLAKVNPEAVGKQFTERLHEHVKQLHAEIKFGKNAKINGRLMSTIQLSFMEQAPNQLFRFARLCLDDETGLPTRYEAWDWSAEGTEKSRSIEEYTFLNVKQITEAEVEEQRLKSFGDETSVTINSKLAAPREKKKLTNPVATSNQPADSGFRCCPRGILRNRTRH